MRTIDVFGVGIALKNWLNRARKHIDPLYFIQLDVLFNNMISARLATRLLPEEALSAYENFLIGSGLLEKHNKEIDDHMVVDVGVKRKAILHKKHLKFDKKIIPPPGFGAADPKPCPEGKEINPKTGRCIKIKQNKTVKMKTEEPCASGKERNPKTRRCVNNCKTGYVRNSDFKCVKDK
jgi:hypothetical protein